MKTRALYLDKNHLNRPGTKISKVTGVVIHWTANEGAGANAEANRNYFNRKWKTVSGVDYELANDKDGKPVKYRQASAHLIIDDGEIVESLPWKKGEAEVGYHVGATSYIAGIQTKLGNQKPNLVTIGLEICVDAGASFKTTYAEAIKLTAQMLKEHGLSVDSLFRHYDVTGKDCPGFHTSETYAYKYLGTKDYKQAWADYKAAVAKLLSPSSSVTTPPANTAKTGASIIKERVYATGGVLKHVDLKGANPYGTKATDVRFIRFPKGEYEYKFVWGKGKTVTQLVKENKADFGFNFPYFWDGMPVSDTKVGANIIASVPTGKTSKWSSFMVKGGVNSIGMQSINTVLTGNEFMVKGSPQLIKASDLVWKQSIIDNETAPDIANGRAQRTFVGTNASGDLLLAVGDGRTTYDQGLTIEEAALYMKSKGAVNALNGDGGGSSVIADSTGSIGQNKGASERVVNHAVLVFKKEATVTPTPPKPEIPTPAPTPPADVWRVFMQGVQKAAFGTGLATKNYAISLYRETQDPNIIAKNPNMTDYYTPVKHPEDFPDLLVKSWNLETKQAVQKYLNEELK